MASDIDTCHFQCVRELRDVSQTHLDKQHSLVGRKMMRFARLSKLIGILLDVAGIGERLFEQ